MRKFLLFLLLVKCAPSFADTAWYYGTINRIWPHDQNGGFIVTFSGPSSIDDCKHKYVYFLSANQSAEMLKNSFSLALSAFHSGDTVGVVMDKDLNGEYCHAMGIDIRK